jgi:hypothetical protein
MKRAIALAAATTAVLVGTGCGSDDGNSGGADPMLAGGDSSGSGLPGQATVTVTFDVTGDVSLSGTTTMSHYPTDSSQQPRSCSEYADGYELEGVRIFVGPDGLDDDIDGKNVLPMIGVHEYDGPGTYADDRLTGAIVGETQLDIDNRGYTVPDQATTELLVNEDGSGTWTFPQLESTQGASISGSMTWTCEDG